MNMMRIVFLTILLTAALVSQLSAQENKVHSKAYALFSKDGNLAPYEFDRHAVGDNDVLIEILYARICHSNLHHVRAEWRDETYPMAPGHEIVGRVVAVGKNLTTFKVGDFAGVGCLVNACGECEHCKKGEEQYCDMRVLNNASRDLYHNNEITQGGYSNNIVVSEKFAIKISAHARLEKINPLVKQREDYCF